MKITIGIDFGSDSARAIAVSARNGEVLSESVSSYKQWKLGLFCDADQQRFRHHPKDYLEALEAVLIQVISDLSPQQRSQICAIGVDATGSTVCPVDTNGTALALLDRFSTDPDAMFHLWKDHSATEEAKEINAVFSSYSDCNYLRFQGTYSAEWFWAKILHTVRTNEGVRHAAATWVELADWIPSVLAGRTSPALYYRCACAAGHKALWNSHFGGLPSKECLRQLDPYLEKVAESYSVPGMATDVVGFLCPEWQEKLGLNGTIIISGSSLDAHAGGVGAGVRPGTLVKVIGTSTVDMAVVAEETLHGRSLNGVCGAAQNSILPGYIGLEAGQASFGDIFAWFSRLLSWPLMQEALLPPKDNAHIIDKILPLLETELKNDPSLGDVIALDWYNGRRYPTNNDSIRSSVVGLSLATDAPRFYRALVCAAVMGSKRLFDGYVDAGIQLNRVVAVGGIAQKSPYVMQMMADALNRTVYIADSQQICALGAAMYAAVASGIWANLPQAQDHMGTGYAHVYVPQPDRQEAIAHWYQKYCELAQLTDEWYG